MAVLDVVLQGTEGNRLRGVPVARSEGDARRAVADLGVIRVVVTEGDGHIVRRRSVEHHGQRVSSATFVELGVAATGADRDPRHHATVNHPDRHIGCRYPGAVVRISGAADIDPEGSRLIAIDFAIFHSADGDRLGSVPVARGEGDCCWRGADLSIERGNGQRYVLGWGGIEYNIDGAAGTTFCHGQVATGLGDGDPGARVVGVGADNCAAVHGGHPQVGRGHISGVEPVVGACNRHGSGGDLIAIGNAILHSAEVDRLGHIPVVRSEGQRVSAEGDFPCIDRDHGQHHIGGGGLDQRDVQGVSSATLDDAGIPTTLADPVASAEVIGAGVGTRAITAASTAAYIGIRRGKVDIIDDGSFTQVAAGLAQTQKDQDKEKAE